MILRIPFLLLAAFAILLATQLSASDAPDFLEPAECPAVSSLPELPIFGPAESKSRAIGPIPPCGNCAGPCAGASAGSQCGVTSGGWIMFCSDRPYMCSDGRPQCVCDVWRQ